jgi:hypothetical protein
LPQYAAPQVSATRDLTPYPDGDRKAPTTESGNGVTSVSEASV